MLLLLATLLSNAASARVLSWPECLGLVSKNNPDLAAARNNYASSDELVSSSVAGFLPTLSGSVNANYNFPNSSTPSSSFTSLAGNTLSSSQSNKVDYSSALTLSYNLFSGFRDRSQLERSRANRMIAAANLDLERAKASYQLRQAFVSLDYAKSYVALTESIIERRSQNQRLVRAQYESGRENEGSYLLSQSLLEQAQFEHLQATHQTELAVQALAHVLGEDANDLDIQGEIPVAEPQKTLAVEQLLPQTPVHRNEEAQVALARANVGLSQAGYFPSLDLSGSVVNRNNLLYTNSNQQWSVGMTLSIPLFSGFKVLHDSRSAADLERAADFTRGSSDFDTLNQLRQSFFNFQESLEKLKVDHASLNALSVQEKIARKQYNNGLLSFQNWDIIEGNLISAQKSALTSKRDRILAESNWRQIQGQGDLP